MTAGASARLITRFSAAVRQGTSVNCWYTMPMPRARASRGLAHGDVGPVQPHAALVGVVEAHDAFDQRGLARAVFAQKRVERPGLDVDRHIVQRHQRPEDLGHAVGLQGWRAQGRGRRAFMAAPPGTSAEVATAPNTPPCILIMSIAARWFSTLVAAQQSYSSRHS